MADDSDDDLPIAEPPKKKAAPVWLVPVLLLVLIPGITWPLMTKVIIPMFDEKINARDGHGETAEALAVQKLAAIQKFEIPQLVTNLSNVDGRYIRVGMTLEGTHKLWKDIVPPNEPRIRNTVIGVLQTLTVQDVAEGSVMNRVRHDLLDHINRALEPAPHVVENLYFSEFVIQ